MSDIEREEFNQWILDSEYALASPATRRWFFDVWQAARARDAEPVALQKVTYEDGVADLVQMDGKSLADYVDGTLFYTRPPAANQGVPEGWLHEVKAERKRQDGKWGGPEHDDQHRPDFFVQLIQDYAGWSRVMAGMGSLEKFRRRMIQVAALAGAAIEATDRALERASTPPQPMEDE